MTSLVNNDTNTFLIRKENEMKEHEIKWLAIMVVGIAAATATGQYLVESVRSAITKAAIEHDYVQKRVGDDVLWVKE